MRKLKLQVQISVDGFIAGPNGEMDWITWEAGEDFIDYEPWHTRSAAIIWWHRAYCLFACGTIHRKRARSNPVGRPRLSLFRYDDYFRQQ